MTTNWLASFVKCAMCNYMWCAVVPEDAPGIECPNCEQMTPLDLAIISETDYHPPTDDQIEQIKARGGEYIEPDKGE